jgi:hypothetical protein
VAILEGEAEVTAHTTGFRLAIRVPIAGPWLFVPILCLGRDGRRDVVAVTLPFEFDTTPVVKVILRGVLGFAVLIVVPGILYSLLVSHSLGATVAMLLVGAITAYFGRLFFLHLSGSAGIITNEGVEVHPSTLHGIPLPGPAGRFRMTQFSAIRVDRAFGPMDTMQAPGWYERVWIVGSPGTPSILIARTDRGTGITLGKELARALRLAYEEATVPG